MPTEPVHRCRVLSSPWPGVYAAVIESGRHYARHWHATYGFGWMAAGAHRSCSGHGAVEAFAGDIVATNPGEVHDGRPLGGASRRWCTVYLPPEFVAAVAAESALPSAASVAFEQPAFRDPRLRHALVLLCERLQAWTDAAPQASALACEEAAVQACALMLRDHSTATLEADAHVGALPQVLDRLADLDGPAASLAELSALAGLGRFQLLRRFRSHYGITPHAWQLQHRAERARGLIAQGAGLADAAAAAGFADHSHLHRVFTRRYGFTPGAWQQAVRARPQ